MDIKREQDLALEKLYNDMYYSMCIYAMNALSDKRIAEEAVQDAFQIACSKPSDVLTSKNPSGWMMNTLKNVIQNIRRQQAKLNDLEILALLYQGETVDSVESSLCFEEMCCEVLGDETYALLRAVAVDKCTMLEAAEEFGITVHACKKRVERAKKKLKEFLENEEMPVPKSGCADIYIVKGDPQYVRLR